MSRSSEMPFTLDIPDTPAESDALMAAEVRASLAETPRRLPSKYFYDERGSILFEQITGLPEYYLTRAEEGLLDANAQQIAERTQPTDLIELGSGSAKKTERLIESGLQAGSLRRYIQVEVSEEMAQHAAGRVAERFPELEVHAVIGDFSKDLGRVPQCERPLVAFLGSTLGNFPEEEARDLLSLVPQVLDDDGSLLLGTDLVKEPQVLEAAYNDSQGVTADFNRNVLRAVNERLGADFDPECFQHVSRYNGRLERIESSLQATERQSVRIDAIDVDLEFEAGESIQTEVSCKYTKETLGLLLEASGLELTDWFTDTDERYALSLSKAA